MPAPIYSHGRPGFYMRVLVGAGDEIDGSRSVPTR
jgi:hypothetical protein